MNDALLPLAICVAIGLLWYDAMRARELAIAHARRLCAEHGAQMLDQSVSLHRLHPSWRGRPHLLRSYRFELSYSGNDRHRASLTLNGERLVDYSLPASGAPAIASAAARPLDNAPPIANPPTTNATGQNVVSITRARRTLH